MFDRAPVRIVNLPFVSDEIWYCTRLWNSSLLCLAAGLAPQPRKTTPFNDRYSRYGLVAGSLPGRSPLLMKMARRHFPEFGRKSCGRLVEGQSQRQDEPRPVRILHFIVMLDSLRRDFVAQALARALPIEPFSTAIKCCEQSRAVFASGFFPLPAIRAMTVTRFLMAADFSERSRKSPIRTIVALTPLLVEATGRPAYMDRPMLIEEVRTTKNPNQDDRAAAAGAR